MLLKKSYFIVALVLVFLTSLPLYGQGFSFYKYYSSDQLNTSNPQNWTAIQDTNGYLFIGNGGGYILNDGRIWTANHIGETGRGNSFFLSSAGQLYANGSFDFGKIASDSVYSPVYQSISSEFYSGDDYVPYIWEVYEINEKIYNRHNYGVVEYDPSSELFKDHVIDENLFWNSFRANNDIIIDANDGLWVFKDSTYERLSQFDEFKDERFIFSSKLKNEQILLGIWKGPIRENEKSLYIYKNGTINVFETEIDRYLTSNIAFKAVVLNDGTIAIATLSGGVVFLNQNGGLIKIFTERNGLHTNEVYNLYVDHEDQLWIMLSEGVQKLDLNTSVLNYGEVYGIEGIIEEMLEMNGTIWAVSEAGIFKSTVLEPEQTLAFSKISNPSLIAVTGLFSIKKKVYIYGSMGLYELLENRIGKKITDQAITNHARDHKNDRIVLLGRNRLLTFDGNVIDEKPISFNGNVIHSSLYEDELFVILSTTNKIYKVTGDSLFEVPIQKKSHNKIYYNHFGIIDEKLYAGIDGTGVYNGLLVYDNSTGEFRMSDEFDINSPISEEQVFNFEQCTNGDVWFAADKKIIKAEKRGPSWTLISKPFNKVSEYGGYSFECTNRGVWIGGRKSLTFINNDFQPDSTSFKTNITGVYVERDSLIYGGYGKPEEAFVLPYKENELRFNYAAASYIDTEKNRYSVKLEGFENSWSDWNSETQKDYTNIPEGTYTFKVRSQNVYEFEGIPDAFTFTIMPPWYRTWWAYLSYVLLICGGIYMIYKIRINQLLRVQRVRNRIADDLHDDLSGTLIGISNFAKAISRNPEKEFQQRFIELIEKSADEAKEKISDIVWTINPQHDQWTNFLTKCRRHASDVFEASEIEYSLEMDESRIGEPSMEIRKNLWLVFKEILTNIVKHSKADYVLVRFKFDKNRLTIFIKDNGKGFDIDTVQKGNGVENIKNRIERISGRVELASEPDKGTAWKISVKV